VAVRIASSLNSCTARWPSVAFAVVSVATMVSFRGFPRRCVPCPSTGLS
jgi:hypothetical protein